MSAAIASNASTARTAYPRGRGSMSPVSGYGARPGNGTNDGRRAPPILGTVNAHPAVMSRRRSWQRPIRSSPTATRWSPSPTGISSAPGCINSDELLERVWGPMDRYHLAWLNVGRDSAPPGSSLDDAGTRRFIAEVASAKLAVLRTMRTSVERQGWSLLSDDERRDDPTEENR